MRTPASIKGHPLHPMLIALPIGLLSFSVIAEIAFRFAGNTAWMAAAYYCLGGGIVTGLIAAIPGFIDWLSIQDPQTRRLGLFHMGSNVSALVLFAISFTMRYRGASLVENGPLVVSLLGLAVLTVGGWLGGSLVYKHRVAVSEANGLATRE